MSKIHVVKDGEHLSGIAAQHGFGNFHTILDHPQNAELKARRDAHVLFPGDQVFIPDRTDKVEPGATTSTHTFAVTAAALFLRVRLRDLDNKPIANASYELRVESPEAPDTKSTDGDGVIVPHSIGRLVKNGELTVTHTLPPLKAGEAPRDETLKFDLKIGGLNPETTLSGQQARLNNLCYFAGFTTDDHDQLIWALEEFQCDHMGQKPVPPSKKPVIKAESTDPNENTGVQDKATQEALRKTHGI